VAQSLTVLGDINDIREIVLHLEERWCVHTRGDEVGLTLKGWAIDISAG
jgi:hypothetical protein